MKYLFYYIGIILIITSCTEDKPEVVTKPDAYNQYLNTSERPGYDEAMNEKEFWSKRLRPDSSGVGDLGPLAAAYTSLFETTANVDYLKDAETLYKKGMDISANSKDIYARALAHNYISQHRFQEAEQLLEFSYAGISSKKATELMLFDVKMELGKYEEAETYLNKIKNTSDYNYLIRMAKWSDFKGDLDGAIKYMEKAKKIAESRDSKSLKIWTYSNLGDFYGHAGRIKDAYRHYLRTLDLSPDNSYAKKGIAWIAYAHEGNALEARRILDSVMDFHRAPDYFLFLAEMAENENDELAANKWNDQFLAAILNPNYGAMYNTYKIELYAETDPSKAVALATSEVGNRATPETYSLLAYATLKSGAPETALKIIDENVMDQTFEPMAAYYSALVYKANGMNTKVDKLKDELLDASFELGPVLTKKVEAL